jgi:5-hydroxyisourate hydrolase
MGRLTTHVLNTATGQPAGGLKIELYALLPEPALLKSVMTNHDGRADSALLDDANMRTSIYELRFFAGDYLRQHGTALTSPAFLDIIPIRFGISDPNQQYHVPLLLSPYGYSTYRGS